MPTEKRADADERRDCVILVLLDLVVVVCLGGGGVAEEVIKSTIAIALCIKSKVKDTHFGSNSPRENELPTHYAVP